MRMTITAIIAICAALATPAFARENQTCYKANNGKTTICEFLPSGRVNVTYDDGAYHSDWYTHREWVRYKANPVNYEVQPGYDEQREALLGKLLSKYLRQGLTLSEASEKAHAELHDRIMNK